MTKEQQIELVKANIIKQYRLMIIADRHWLRSDNFNYTYIRNRANHYYQLCYRWLLRNGMDGVSIRGLTFKLEF